MLRVKDKQLCNNFDRNQLGKKEWVYLISLKNNEKMKTTEQIYKQINSLLLKHKDVIVYDVDSLISKSKVHLFGLELKEKYNLNLDPSKVDSFSWNRFGDYMSIGWWGEKYRRTISWSDTDEQPIDELLLQISFPTGAFIFGNDYPTKFFQQFFKELKTYNPKYSDTVNHNLYFSMDNANIVFNSFNDILKKYYELNREDVKQRKIEQMKSDLAKLEKSAD